MLANFSFDLSSVHLHIGGGGGLKKSGAIWVANCKTNFRDVTTDFWPLRGDVSFLNQYPAEITILPFSLPDVELDFYQAGLAKQIAKGIEEGYPAPVDALGIRYLDAKASSTDSGFLGIVRGIERSNYEIADKVLQRHLGRSDLMCNIGCISEVAGLAGRSLQNRAACGSLSQPSVVCPQWQNETRGL
jgi:hypothetical protein